MRIKTNLLILTDDEHDFILKRRREEMNGSVEKVSDHITKLGGGRDFAFRGVEPRKFSHRVLVLLVKQLLERISEIEKAKDRRHCIPLTGINESYGS